VSVPTKARKGNVIAWPTTVHVTPQPGSGLEPSDSTTWRLGICASADRAGMVKTVAELHYGTTKRFALRDERYVVDPGRVVLDIEGLTAAYAELHRREDYRPLRTAEETKALVQRFTLAGNPS